MFYLCICDMIIENLEAATRGVLWKKVFLEILQNSQENTCTRVSFLIKLQANFIKKETLGYVFTCEFCQISKNTFSYRTLTVATSEDQINLVTILKFASLNPHFENFTKNKRRVMKYSTSFSVYSCLWKSCYTKFRYI